MPPNETSNTDLASAEILWKSADTLRGQIDAAEYEHVVLEACFREGKRLMAVVRERLNGVGDAR